jgi:hypothetical protein
MNAESTKIPIDRSRPTPSSTRRADDSFTDLDRLDRPELDDDEADWEKETAVRRKPAAPPLPSKPKLADCG